MDEFVHVWVNQNLTLFVSFYDSLDEKQKQQFKKLFMADVFAELTEDIYEKIHQNE